MIGRTTILSLLVLIFSLTGLISEPAANMGSVSIYVTEQEHDFFGSTISSPVRQLRADEYPILADLPKMSHNCTMDNEMLLFPTNRLEVVNVGPLRFLCVKAMFTALHSVDCHHPVTRGRHPLKLPLRIFRELWNRSAYVTSLNGLW